MIFIYHICLLLSTLQLRPSLHLLIPFTEDQDKDCCYDGTKYRAHDDVGWVMYTDVQSGYGYQDGDDQHWNTQAASLMSEVDDGCRKGRHGVSGWEGVVGLWNDQ